LWFCREYHNEGDLTKTVTALNFSDVVESPNDVIVKIEHSDDTDNAFAHIVGDASETLFLEHAAHIVTPNGKPGKRSGNTRYVIAPPKKNK
jgi:hypothetical protein